MDMQSTGIGQRIFVSTAFLKKHVGLLAIRFSDEDEKLKIALVNPDVNHKTRSDSDSEAQVRLLQIVSGPFESKKSNQRPSDQPSICSQAYQHDNYYY